MRARSSKSTALNIKEQQNRGRVIDALQSLVCNKSLGLFLLAIQNNRARVANVKTPHAVAQKEGASRCGANNKNQTLLEASDAERSSNDVMR
jgi:hypothetical protein